VVRWMLYAPIRHMRQANMAKLFSASAISACLLFRTNAEHSQQAANRPAAKTGRRDFTYRS
jgi:hypothetical protein